MDVLDDTKPYVIAVIEHTTRCIRVLGAADHPMAEWVAQRVRNLLMDLDGSTGRIRFLIRDRDILHPPGIAMVLYGAGIRTMRSVVRASRMNAVMERWTGGCRR